MYPTTLVRILYNTGSVDSYDDLIDTYAVRQDNVPATITERNQNVFNPASGTPRVIRSIICRLPGDTVVQQDDRIYNIPDGSTYTINDITSNTSPAQIQDLIVELTRVS